MRRNIRSVAQSLLPVALYNPAGRKRRDLLEETLAVFREHRGEDVLCAYVKNAGREQETKWAGKLSEFPAAEVDMSTLIIIGGPRTRLDSGVLYEPARLCGEVYGIGGSGNRRNGDSAFRKGSRSPPEHSALRFPPGALPGLRKAKTLTNLLCIITYWGNAKS